AYINSLFPSHSILSVCLKSKVTRPICYLLLCYYLARPELLPGRCNQRKLLLNDIDESWTAISNGDNFHVQTKRIHGL
ncbi:hypothetical protein PRIPAC_84821, partial [Pristionchus pacificus]|uniref:Uncharacterized protein n=1 Tax=Pristionchus pacificus TaxID=54126 RepID=A0A2A6BRW2_PRIPA